MIIASIIVSFCLLCRADPVADGLVRDKRVMETTFSFYESYPEELSKAIVASKGQKTVVEAALIHIGLLPAINLPNSTPPSTSLPASFIPKKEASTSFKPVAKPPATVEEEDPALLAGSLGKLTTLFTKFQSIFGYALTSPQDGVAVFRDPKTVLETFIMNGINSMKWTKKVELDSYLEKVHRLDAFIETLIAEDMERFQLDATFAFGLFILYGVIPEKEALAMASSNSIQPRLSIATVATIMGDGLLADVRAIKGALSVDEWNYFKRVQMDDVQEGMPFIQAIYQNISLFLAWVKRHAATGEIVRKVHFMLWGLFVSEQLTVSYFHDLDTMKKLVAIKQKLLEDMLAINRKAYFAAGYKYEGQRGNSAGHALIAFIRPAKDSEKYHIRLINSGEGLQFHDVFMGDKSDVLLVDENGEVRNPRYRFYPFFDCPAQTMKEMAEAEFFRVHEVLQREMGFSGPLVHQVYACRQGLPKRLPTSSGTVYPQRSGTCTFSSQFYLIEEMGKNLGDLGQLIVQGIRLEAITTITSVELDKNGLELSELTQFRLLFLAAWDALLTDSLEAKKAANFTKLYAQLVFYRDQPVNEEWQAIVIEIHRLLNHKWLNLMKPRGKIEDTGGK